MSDFFRKFPIITYDGVRVRDITRRVALATKSLSDPLLFLPYTVREGEKPEDIAYLYYGSVDYTWLVLLSNGLTDPYSDWTMDTELFSRFFMTKYAEVSGEADYEIIAWGQNTLITDNIVFYYREDEQGGIIKVSPDTFNWQNEEDWDGALSDVGWTPMRAWDYESDLNDAKRNIQLVDKIYKDKIDNEFRKLIVK